MRRVLHIFLALALCFSLSCTPVFATEPPTGPVYELMNDIETKASSPPSSFYNLGGDVNYYVGELIDLAATKGSYTRYYFATSSGSIYLKLNLERSGTTTNKSRTLQIKLYEKATASSNGVLLDTKTISFDTSPTIRRTSFSGLDPNKFYYLYFFNDSGTSASSSLDISAVAVVDDSFPA